MPFELCSLWHKELEANNSLFEVKTSPLETKSEQLSKRVHLSTTRSTNANVRRP